MYDKNGNQINDDGTTVGSKNPFRYRGYYWDREFRLYYLQSRYYDPALGRFISPDGIDYIDPSSINGMNLYAYCDNNPVMYTDPTGYAEWWQWLLGGLLVVGVTVLTAGGAAFVTSTFGLSSATVSGAAFGSFTTGSMSLIAQGKTGNKEIDYGRLALDTFWGGATGAFSGAVSGAYSQKPFPVYFGKQTLLNISIYSGSYFLLCGITGDELTLVGLFMAAAGGAVNGMVSGWTNTASFIASFFGAVVSYWEAFLEWVLGSTQED